MADGYRERKEWKESGEWLIKRLKARLEDRINEDDIQIEVAENINNAVGTV